MLVFAWVLFGAILTYALTKGTGPFYMRSDQTIASPDGGMALQESYEPIGLIKFCFLFIGLGFVWAMNEPTEQMIALLLGFPFYIIAASGLFQFFFRRRHVFFLQENRVIVETSHLTKSPTRTIYDYSQIKTRVELRAIGKGQRYCALLRYPDFEVAAFLSADKDEAETHLRTLKEKLKLPE